MRPMPAEIVLRTPTEEEYPAVHRAALDRVQPPDERSRDRCRPANRRTRSVCRSARRRRGRGLRRRIYVPPDRARRRGRRRGDHLRWRAPDPSPPRDPAPDDGAGCSTRPGRATSRWRSCGRPKPRSTSALASAPRRSRRSSRRRPTRSGSSGRSIRPGRSGSSNPMRRSGSSRRSTTRSCRRSRARSTALLRDGERNSSPTPSGHRHDNGDKVLAVHEQDGAPTGYVIYRQRPEWDVSGPKSVLTVIEVAALDPISEQAIWQWLFSIDLIGTVRVWRGPAPHPLHLLVTEPSRLSTTLNDGLWLRIIDLPAALEARSYAGGGPARARGHRRVPAVQRRTLDALHGGRRLRPGQGTRATRRAQRRRPTSRSTSPTWRRSTSARSGFADLARVGRVMECRPGGMARADALFSHPGRPNTATMF